MTDLKTKFEKKTIGQIEKEIKGNLEKSIEARKDAYLALNELKRSGRYKENPLYAKSSFKVYLEEVYTIKETSFTESVIAFKKYPNECKKLNVGVITKIRRVCGAKNASQVFKEIAAKEKTLKTPIKRGQIENIIEAHAKPRAEVKAKPDYQTLYNSERRAHQATKDMYTETIEELKAARNQIERLKTTILSFREVVGERELEVA